MPPARARHGKLLTFGRLLKRKQLHHMVQSAILSSVSYGHQVLGTNNTELREARHQQAQVESARVDGRSISLMLLLSDVDKVDPAYKLCKGPLMALASAVWDSWMPLPILRSGVKEAWGRLSQHTSPWQSIRGPFSACVASALRLGISMQGLQWHHPSIGDFSPLDLSPRTLGLIFD
eukprot:5601988-Pyramimonas_sp.AAC.1